jgi:glycosyltransferase involved in cell wall biosynthesis
MDEGWIKQNKNNDKMLKAFAKLLALRPETNPRLFLLEYGSDIIPTKNLIGELEIVSSVTWLPKMKRKELMWVLAKVSVSLGEFIDLEKMTWGGTGWEALAVGRPLIQGFNFAEGEFEKLMGYPPPPLLPVRKQDDILHHLLYLIDNPDQIKAIGNASKQWFEAYNGISLSRQWLSLLEKSDNQKEQVAGMLTN